MATICISLAGEGRGHATRIRSVVEQLRLRHKVVLFAGGDACEFLGRCFQVSGASAQPVEVEPLEVRPIETLRFHYARGRVSLGKTLVRAARFAGCRLSRQVADLERQLRTLRPDLVVYDFEPSLPRAADRLGIPAISFDHQHFLVASDFRDLELSLRLKVRLSSLAVRACDCRPRAIITTSFCQMPLRRGWEHVIRVGPILRAAVRNLVPRDDGFVLAYLRPQAQAEALNVLARCGREVHVYGLGERPREGRLTFHALDEAAFTDHLGRCHAIAASAGNQLLGESIHLGKPFLALPEARLYEQMINAQLLARWGVGAFCPLERVDDQTLAAFLESNQEFRRRLQPYCGRYDDTRKAVEAIESHLPSQSPVTSGDEGPSLSESDETEQAGAAIAGGQAAPSSPGE